MEQKSNKKSLYNNVFEPINTIKTAHELPRPVQGSYGKVYGFSLWILTLPQVVVLLLLVSLCLQPFFAHAEDEVPTTTESIPGEIVEVSEVAEEPQSAEVEDMSESESEPVYEEQVDKPEDVSDEAIEVSTVTEYSQDDNEDEQIDLSEETSENDTATSTTASPVEQTVTTTADTSAESSAATSTHSQNQDQSDSNASTGSSGGSSSTDDEDEPEPDTDSRHGGSDEEEVDDTESEADPDAVSDQTGLSTDSGETASTTEPDEDATVVAVVHTDSAFSFTESECTLVDDGSYYCHKAPDVPIEADDLFAAPDQDGDLEIFMRRGGVQVQLTNNQVDDASPFYDPSSNTIVWHRLETDRYQIITYDLDRETETQLTNTSVNNMEPTRSGDYLVWQRWVKNNWEIVLYNANTQTQTMLTESIAHDIAPHIRGDLVIWNVRHSDGTHVLQTYEISSGLYNEISDPDGVAVSNPRMVVVYDAQYQNGDTVTKGFDLVTGEIVPLQQVPRELPDTLPDPDSTGETRALVAPSIIKPENDDGESDDDGDTRNSNPDPGTLDLASSTAPITVDSISSTLQLPDEVFELDLSATNTPDTEQVIDDEVFELIVPSSALVSTSTQTNN